MANVYKINQINLKKQNTRRFIMSVAEKINSEIIKTEKEIIKPKNGIVG